MVSFRGQKKLGPRPDRSPLGFKSTFPTSIPTPFICGVPPPGENLHKLTRGHSRDVREEVCRHFTTLFQTRDLIS